MSLFGFKRSARPLPPVYIDDTDARFDLVLPTMITSDLDSDASLSPQADDSSWQASWTDQTEDATQPKPELVESPPEQQAPSVQELPETEETAAPGPSDGLPLPPGVQLTSKHDIYNHDHSVLLIRAGQTVNAELLPKLLNFGVSPRDFSYVGTPANQAQASATPIALPLPAARMPVTRPETHRELSPEVAAFAAGLQPPLTSPQRKILILDPDDRGIGRLTDCLVACGIPLHDIHPVRMVEHLTWAVRKYQPEMLFIDFNLGKGRHGFEVIRYIADSGLDPAVVLTLQLMPEKVALREKILAAAETLHASVLFKPINRYDLYRILQRESMVLPDFKTVRWQQPKERVSQVSQG
jgi:hypothetical protein